MNNEIVFRFKKTVNNEISVLRTNRNCLIRGPPEFCLGWMAMAQVKFKISHVNVTYASAHTYKDCSS